MEDNFSIDLTGGRGWFGDDSNALRLLCTSFLLLLHQLQPQIIRHYIPKVGVLDLGNVFGKGRWQKVGTEVQMREGGLWSARTDSGDGESLIQGLQREYC